MHQNAAFLMSFCQKIALKNPVLQSFVLCSLRLIFCVFLWRVISNNFHAVQTLTSQSQINQLYRNIGWLL